MPLLLMHAHRNASMLPYVVVVYFVHIMSGERRMKVQNVLHAQDKIQTLYLHIHIHKAQHCTNTTNIL